MTKQCVLTNVVPNSFLPQISIEMSFCKDAGKGPAASHWTDRHWALPQLSFLPLTQFVVAGGVWSLVLYVINIKSKPRKNVQKKNWRLKAMSITSTYHFITFFYTQIQKIPTFLQLSKYTICLQMFCHVDVRLWT